MIGVSEVVNGTITSTGKLDTLLRRVFLNSSLARDLVARLCHPDPKKRIVEDLEPRGPNPLRCAWRHPYLWTDEEFAEIIHKIDEAKKGSDSWPKEIYDLSTKDYSWKQTMEEFWPELHNRIKDSHYRETYLDLCRLLRNLKNTLMVSAFRKLQSSSTNIMGILFSNCSKPFGKLWILIIQGYFSMSPS